MSIINEALKKVQEIRKEHPSKDTAAPSPAGIEAKPHISLSVPANKKGIVKIAGIVVIIGVTAIALLKTTGILFPKKTIPAAPVSTRPQPRALPKPAPETENPSVAPSSSSQDDSLPTLILNGIVYDEQRPYAIVNNRVLQKGEEIEGAQLIEIYKDKVKFLFQDREIELNAR